MYTATGTYSVNPVFFGEPREKTDTQAKNRVNAYTFGFNGQEKDNEVSGIGNSLDFGERIYNSRLGKFLSIDGLTINYPMLAPYQFASNCPISGIDIDGLEFYYAADGSLIGNIGTSTEVRVVNEADIVSARWNIGMSNYYLEKMQNSGEMSYYTESMKFKAAADGQSTRHCLDNDELNTRAFLATITTLESGAYNRKIGGGTFEGNEHPGGQTLRFGKTKVYVSAAGAYQITEGTYEWLKEKDNSITNFSPKNQDKMAVMLIDTKGALEDVKQGKISEAASKLNRTWSSLPGGSEETKNLDETKQIFQEKRAGELNNNSQLATPQGSLENTP